MPYRSAAHTTVSITYTVNEFLKLLNLLKLTANFVVVNSSRVVAILKEKQIKAMQARQGYISCTSHGKDIPRFSQFYAKRPRSMTSLHKALP